MVAPEGWAVFTEAYNDIEADIILAVLRSRGIPALKREKEFTTGIRVIMGQAYGVDLLLPLHLFEEAREVLKQAQKEGAGPGFPADQE